MKLSGNTVLISGGASGIGLALAERFLQTGNEVIVCGRRPDKLREAKQQLPQLHTKVCDVASEADRIALYDWVTVDFPALNILVNNAGIQQRVNLLRAGNEWNYYRQELAINLEAPIHLSMLFVPHLLRQQQAYIVNITSGLAFTPPAWVPVYGATKAGLHSFTVSLRLQLADTNIGVIEVLPPAVNTDLGGVGLHTFGAPVDDFAQAVFTGFEANDWEIGYGSSLNAIRATRGDIDKIVLQNWTRMKK